MGTPVRAVIDVGTNSVKLLVASVANSDVNPLLETSGQTRLGRGLFASGQLNEQAIRETVDVISQYVETAREHGANSIKLIGTSAAREAVNVDELKKAIRDSSGLELEVISWETEAKWVYAGVAHGVGMRDEALVVVDIGGGSTEIIAGHGKQAQRHLSLPLGTVRLMDQFPQQDPPISSAYRECRRSVAELLEQGMAGNVVEFRESDVRMVGCGGTATLLGRMANRLDQYQRDVIERTVLSRGDLEERVEFLWSMSQSERAQLPGLPAEKADVIPFGALVFAELMKAFDARELSISMRGLRFGALLQE